MNEFLEEESHGTLRARRSSDQKRVKWDPTINLGHVLSVAAFMISLFGSILYFNSRVVVLEEYRASHMKDTARIEADVSELKKSLGEDIKEIRKDIREILISKNRVPK